MSEKKKTGCFRIGCFGCLGLSIVLILFTVLLSFLQVARERSGRETVTRTVVRELPRIEELERMIERGEIGEGGALSIDPSVLASPEIASRIGRLELDLDLGEFRIEAGEPGSEIEVDADFEEDAFRFEEELIENDDGSATYRVTLRPRGGMLGLMFRGAGNNPRNDLTIRIPPDRPIDLVGKIGLGSSRLDLGGLWLRRVEIEAGTGEHTITFDEPLRSPLERLVVNKSVGELDVESLGNASPLETELIQGVGELTIDLSGAWVNDSEVRLSNRIGEVTVRAPDRARLDVDRASVAIGERRLRVPSQEDIPEDAPVVKLIAEGRIGEIRIR